MTIFTIIFIPYMPIEPLEVELRDTVYEDMWGKLLTLTLKSNVRRRILLRA